MLALDIGSSSARSALFNERGKRLAGTSAAREYALRYRADGAAELDARKLRSRVAECVRETLRERGDVAAVGVSAFWHSLLGLDKNRQPITPIYMWADSRAATDADRLRERFDERAVHARTGCMLRASFWPAKLAWLRRTDSGLFRRVRFWVSPVNWIVEELSGASGCSESMASATGLFNSAANDWDKELCDACGINADALENVCSIAAVAGRGRRPRLQIDSDAQVFTAIGDGAAGNLGSGADEAGVFAINIGTSAAVRTIATRQPCAVPFGLFRYVHERRAVIGGAVSNGGNLRRWCLRELRVDEKSSSRVTPRERRAFAQNRLDVLPFFVSERAPTWPENIQGTITGLTQSTTALQIERAAQRGVFYRLAQILELTESATARARKIIVSGGILHAPPLLALLADALGRDVIGAAESEASLRGAAVHAFDKMKIKIEPLSPGKIVKHDRQLARLHRVRRQRQIGLEELLHNWSS